MNFLVETKNEYTKQLTNVITPIIYSGILSIYNDTVKALDKKEENKILKIFQKLIKDIPRWNNNIVANETNRIKTSSKCDFLEDLLKAVIKANIILLTNSNTIDEPIKNIYMNLNLSKFIHRCYIECAKEIYNSPYLFYHKISPIDKKRNQREIIILIKKSIEEAIRKLLPVKYILQKYLGNNIEQENHDNFDNVMSENEKKNLKEMITQELSYDKSSFKSSGSLNKSLNSKPISEKLESNKSLNSILDSANSRNKISKTDNKTKSTYSIKVSNKLNSKSQELQSGNSKSSNSKAKKTKSNNEPYELLESEDYEAVFSNIKQNSKKTNLSNYFSVL